MQRTLNRVRCIPLILSSVPELHQLALVDPLAWDTGLGADTSSLVELSDCGSDILNSTGCSAFMLTGIPPTIGGENFHLRTAANVGLFRNRLVELTTTGLRTSPLAVMVKATTTSPSTPDWRRSMEYAGAGCEIGFGFCMAADADTVSAAASKQDDMERIFIWDGFGNG
jgi:hypothetical protein